MNCIASVKSSLATRRKFSHVLCCVLFVTAGCSAPASVAPASPMRFDAGWVNRSGVLYHVPHYMLARGRRVALHPGFLMTYGGGPVLVKPKVYVILWGYKRYGDAQGVAPLLEFYLKNMGGSRHNNIYTQYYEVADGSEVDIENEVSQLGGIWDDEKTPVPKYPTDEQVAAESLNGVVHFGYDSNGSYLVATPRGRSTEGFGTQWCAYHSSVYSGQNLVSYTNFPYVPDARSNCGANVIKPPPDESGADEGVTIVEGHEEG